MQGTAALQGIGGIGAPAAAPVRQGVAAAGFRVAEQGAPGAVRAPAGAAAPSALLGLLAVQEAEADAARDRSARKRGKQMLDELSRLQRALLAGRVDPDGLRSLAALATDPAEAADPALAATLRAVAVRARIELARLRAAASG